MPAKGQKQSNEARKRMSESHKGQIAWNKGKSLSEEHRRKIGLSSKGRIPSQETRRKISESGKGRKLPPFTEEHRRKIGLASKGRKHSEESKKTPTPKYGIIKDMAKSKEITEIATQVAAQLSATAARTASNLASTPNPDHDAITTLIGSVSNLDQKFTEKFADLKTDIKNLSDGTATTISKHEDRISKLEQRQWIWAGGITVLVFIAPYIISTFSK